MGIVGMFSNDGLSTDRFCWAFVAGQIHGPVKGG